MLSSKTQDPIHKVMVSESHREGSQMHTGNADLLNLNK